MSEQTQADRRKSMKERAKEARREAYQRAKERMKNDPKQIALKEELKERRSEANKQAKERRKNDPRQIELKKKLTQRRREASKTAKDQRKARASAAKSVDRAKKVATLMSAMRPSSQLLPDDQPKQVAVQFDVPNTGAMADVEDMSAKGVAEASAALKKSIAEESSQRSGHINP